MVSVSVFAVVMVLCMGTVVTIMEANRKSQTLRAVMDNLNFAMESMTRNIRFGYNYHCGAIDTGLPADCNAGDTTLYITDSNGVRTKYSVLTGGIVETVGAAANKVTSPDITVQSLTFRVYGSSLYSGGADRVQPKVVIVVRGYSGLKPSSKTSFTLETTVSQRKFDFQ